MELVHISSHQRLQELEDEVEASMGLAYIRLDWMPESEEPFEAKAFVLRHLKAQHAVLCAQHFHAPSVPQKGTFGTACAYCGYGHKNANISAGVESKFKFGVNV